MKDEGMQLSCKIAKKRKNCPLLIFINVTILGLEGGNYVDLYIDFLFVLFCVSPTLICPIKSQLGI